MIKSNRGQLTIFMGISLIIMMSMLAFIINVGLFVKAKINLQNAVDSAAFAGAATQSRQLTNIAYMNWELRNTYKEWLFKYYIMGQMGMFPYNFKDANISGTGQVNFLLSIPPGFNFTGANVGNNVAFDSLNVPSICIHNNVSQNICPLYMIPGLPRYKSIGVAGITEIHESLVNQLVTDKAKDCSDRTKINFLAALSWTYGSGITDVPGAPLIAANRPGAWIQALEVAMRIRNLEMITNRPPISAGFSYNDMVNSLLPTGADIAYNERPIKAMMSAYKNLSGGKYKENGGDELSGNFKLYELPPTPFEVSHTPVSNFLIPTSGFSYPGPGLSTSPMNKYYLDLQIMTVNYALMYSTFSSTKYTYDGVAADASCGISKTALPVPGYILGFVKNPNVMTYYAVKGESKFIGLFYPFRDALQDGIHLNAYAAAKPYGGRIGPSLFAFGNSGSTIIPREDSQHKSKPYVMGLRPPTAGTPYQVGYPIPFDGGFWVSTAAAQDVLGGIPGAAAVPTYGIPNMIYDFENYGELGNQIAGAEAIQDIKFVSVGSHDESMGLYDKAQFRALRKNIGASNPGTTINSDQVTAAILKSRRATKYDVINYLVPDIKSISSGSPNTTSYVIPEQLYPGTSGGSAVYQYKLFAPLTGGASGISLYANKERVKDIITQYLAANESAVKVYLKDLLNVATSIANTTTGTGDTNLLMQSAKSIHVKAPDPSGTNYVPDLLDGLTGPPCDNVDVASQFNQFFKGSNVGCGIVPISIVMNDYVEKHSDTLNGSNIYYVSTYYDGSATDGSGALDPAQLMTAYYPGDRQGASNTGNIANPLTGGDIYSGKRNFYSTKFFHMAKIVDSPPSVGVTLGKADYEKKPLLMESGSSSPTDLVGKVNILNPLKYDATTGINNPYFLDF